MARLQPQSWKHASLELLSRATPVRLAVALVLVALFGCGDDDTTILTDCLGQPPSKLCPSSPTETAQPTATPTRIPIEVPTLTTPIVLCYEVSGSPCPTETPTPDYQPAKATISCFTINRTPAAPCPTWTPS